MKLEQRENQVVLTFDTAEELIPWADEAAQREIVQLKDTLTRCQRDCNEALKRRRQAEWEVLKLRDELAAGAPDPGVVLMLQKLSDDLEKIGATGWRDRVQAIIEFAESE